MLQGLAWSHCVLNGIAVKHVLLLGLLVITQVLGDIWLSQGMKLFGEVDFALETVVQLIGYLFTSPWIWLGVGTLIVSLLCYMSAISRLDLSYVLPMHALTHVLNAFLAWLILHESVSGLRWLATIIIAVGVFIVGWSQQREPPPQRLQRRDPAPMKMRRHVNAAPYWFPLGLYFSKVGLGVMVLVCADAVGDLFTAMGMKQVGEGDVQVCAPIVIVGGADFLPSHCVGGDCRPYDRLYHLYQPSELGRY